MEQLSLFDVQPIDTSIIGYNASLVEYGDDGEVLSRCGLNWPEPFETINDVEVWAKSLKERGLIGGFESIEPRPIFKTN